MFHSPGSHHCRLCPQLDLSGNNFDLPVDQALVRRCTNEIAAYESGVASAGIGASASLVRALLLEGEAYAACTHMSW